MFCNVSYSNVPYRMVMEWYGLSLEDVTSGVTIEGVTGGVAGPLPFLCAFLLICLARNSIAFPQFRMILAKVACTSFFTFSSGESRKKLSFLPFSSGG